MKKYNINFCRRIAIGRQGKCLSHNYTNIKTKLVWSCNLGHIWNARLSDILYKGTWCPTCFRVKQSKNFKLQDGLSIAKRIAKENKGRCLSSNYTNLNKKLLWLCYKGHKWQASLRSIKYNRSWCPKCNYNTNSLIIANKIASKNNGKCISKTYINSKFKLLWECNVGHKWFATLASVKYYNSWCPYCAKLKINGLYEAKKIAFRKNGLCLSKKYINIRSRLKWQCDKGHIWWATLHDVKNSSSWCPECNLSKSQNNLYKVFQYIFPNYNIYFNYRKLDFLKNPETKRPLEADIFVSNIKLIVEYDGEHHSKPITFGNMSLEQAKKNLAIVKKRDILKDKIIKKAIKDGKINYFLRFKYYEPISIEYIEDKLKENYII